MDFLRIFISCIAIICFPSVAEAGCVQDIEGSQGFTHCLMGCTWFMRNAFGTMVPNDTQAIMDVVCSAGGKAAMKCLFDYVKTCPELMTSGQTATMMQSLQALGQRGGLERACNTVLGPCETVQQCLYSQASMVEETPSQSSPLSVVLDSVKILCGPLKGVFDCFKDVGDQCQDLENHIKTMVDSQTSQVPKGYPVPSYDQSKAFAMNECPKLPSDFSTNTCVKKNIDSDDFVNCYVTVIVNHTDSDAKTSCDANRTGHECVSMTVGKNCRAEYTHAFTKIIPLFLKNLPSNCKLESTTSSSSLVQTSSLTVFTVSSSAYSFDVSFSPLFAVIALAFMLI